MQKILIANRGEIAARIIKSCKRLKLDTVAVYSDADKDLPYTKMADETVHLGEAPAAKSYMDIEKIISAAKDTGADAVHPGYGFLSENADFAERVKEAGLIFIGPKAETIRQMGDKVTARQVMKKSGVPVVPGTEDAVSDVDEAIRHAEEIGYPVMLKASAGGGGVGMQLCRTEAELTKAFNSNQKRAAMYFGNGDMFIEKAIVNGRHIEIQIMADRHGNVRHFFERDCSVQRRHQKVVEEALSPFISEKTRKEMTESAIKAAEATGYINAGTLEFIVDENENHYFLEMNTRLQVEHPVTESVTGVDLVELQLKIADGEQLSLPQSDISATGHAIEFRLYAEDPKTFYPSPGKITKWELPEGPGIRIDAGYTEGNQVTPFYDPMIAKLIFTGDTRQNALDTARKFVDGSSIEGIKTNLPLFKKILDNQAFAEGKYTTALISKINDQE